MQNKELVLNQLLSYTEDEKIYKTYYELRNAPKKQEEYVQSLDRNFIIQHNILLPNFPEVYFPEELQEQDLHFNFGDISNRFVFLNKHYRYTPVIEHSHDYFEIIYMLRGSCHQMLGGENLPLHQGDICFIPPHTKHTLEIFDDSVAINITVRRSKFQEIFLSNMRQGSLLTHFFLSSLYSKRPMRRIVFSTGLDTQIEATILSMYLENISDDEYSSQVLDHMLPLLFINIQRKYSKSASVIDGTSATNPAAMKLIEYINSNSTVISLNELADHFHYSVSHCSRLIKEETGMTYTAFLRHLRMSKAATMLLNSNNSVAYISELMGFLNTETFIRTFQKEFHETPTQYRKHYKN